MEDIYSKIKKFAYVINEGFDFDNELESEELDTIISKNMTSNFDYLVNYDNLKIPIKDLFLEVFGCATPFATSNKYIDIVGIGPVLYTPKYYKDIDNFLFDLSKNPSLLMSTGISPMAARKNYYKLKDAGWKFYSSCSDYSSELCYGFPPKSKKPIPHSIMQLLELLANKVDVYNVENFESSGFKDLVAFAISPDNGVVIVDTIISRKAIQYATFKPKYPICWNMIFYTGLQLYNKSSHKSKDELNYIKAKEKLLNILNDKCGFTLTKLSDNDNRLCQYILNNGHYILPLGSNKYPYGSQWSRIIRKRTNKGASIIQEMDDNTINFLTKIEIPLPLFFRILFNIPRCLDINKLWKCAYANSKLLVFEHFYKNFIKIFVTPSLNVIEKLFGSEIKDLCKDRPTIIQNADGHGNNMKAYGVLWLSEDVNNLIAKFANKELKVPEVSKIIENGTL